MASDPVKSITLVSILGSALEGEAIVVTSSMPTTTDTSPGSTPDATCAGAAGCVLRVAAGRAAEASETVIASRRSVGRSSSATAGTLAVLLLFRVAIVGCSW